MVRADPSARRPTSQRVFARLLRARYHGHGAGLRRESTALEVVDPAASPELTRASPIVLRALFPPFVVGLAREYKCLTRELESALRIAVEEIATARNGGHRTSGGG